MRPGGRRSLLAGLAGLTLAPALGSCVELERLARQAELSRSAPPPTPAERRRVRVARAGLPELAAAGGLTLLAGERVATARAVRYEVEAVPVTKSTGEARVVVSDPQEFPDVFAAQVAAGSPADAPDLVLADAGWISALARARAVYDLGSFLRDEPWFKADEFAAGALRPGQVRGQQVGLPLAIGAEALLYNARIFEEVGAAPPQPGWGWTDMLRAARAISRRPGGARAGRWGFLVGPRAPTLFSLAWQQGAQVVAPDGARLDLTEPGTVRAVEFLVDLIQAEGVAPAVDERDPRRFLELWAQKELAMAPTIVSGPVWWHAGNYDGTELCELPDQRRGVLGTAPILVAVPRGAPDLKHSLNALRGLVEAAPSALLLPARRNGPPLRQMNTFLTEADATTLGSALGALRFLPGDFPLTQLAPLLDRELMLPALTGRKPPRVAVRDAQAVLERRLADLRGPA
jgi:hypothetical protein